MKIAETVFLFEEFKLTLKLKSSWNSFVKPTHDAISYV
jgi:hypothetical protein